MFPEDHDDEDDVDFDALDSDKLKINLEDRIRRNLALDARLTELERDKTLKENFVSKVSPLSSSYLVNRSFNEFYRFYKISEMEDEGRAAFLEGTPVGLEVVCSMMNL
jgi:hypothetical protein